MEERGHEYGVIWFEIVLIHLKINARYPVSEYIASCVRSQIYLFRSSTIQSTYIQATPQLGQPPTFNKFLLLRHWRKAAPFVTIQRSHFFKVQALKSYFRTSNSSPAYFDLRHHDPKTAHSTSKNCFWTQIPATQMFLDAPGFEILQ
jgi:hypothetical protein